MVHHCSQTCNNTAITSVIFVYSQIMFTEPYHRCNSSRPKLYVLRCTLSSQTNIKKSFHQSERGHFRLPPVHLCEEATEALAFFCPPISCRLSLVMPCLSSHYHAIDKLPPEMVRCIVLLCLINYRHIKDCLHLSVCASPGLWRPCKAACCSACQRRRSRTRAHRAY